MPMPTRRNKQRQGSIITLVTFMMIVVIVMGAMALEIAHVQLVKMQLRKATDAAAHAGAEALARTQDATQGVAAAKRVAALNSVMGGTLELQDQDVTLGRVNYFNGAWKFNATGSRPNAVRVLSEIRSSGFSTSLGKIAGVDRIDVSESATAANVTRDICLVLDRSGSMAFDMSGVDWSYPPGRDYCKPPHPSKSRWAAVQDAVEVFARELVKTKQQEKVCLVTYSTDYDSCDARSNQAQIDQTLTSNYGKIRSALAHLSQKPIIGGTAIAAGIDDGVNALSDTSLNRSFADKLIVLLTDGHENSGRPSTQAADDAAAAGITMHTITFSTHADEPRMKDVANRTGGRHFHAPDKDRLIMIFQEIARGIPIVMTE